MRSARAEQVLLGSERALVVRGATVASGIFKTAREGPQRIETFGLVGDSLVSPRRGREHHAVHVYPVEHYATWAARYPGGPFHPGGFGENLSVRGATEVDVRLGDVVACGSTVLVVAQPRIPCSKLTARVGVPGFAREFLESTRVGYYLSVRVPGWVKAGDAFEVVERDEDAPSMADFVRISQLDYWDDEGLERLLAARGLPAFWREPLEDKLERARLERARGRWFGTRTLRVVTRERDGEVVTLGLVCGRGRPLPSADARGTLVLVVAAGPHRGWRWTGSLVNDVADGEPYRVAIRAREGSTGAALAMLAVGGLVHCLAPT